MSVLICVGGDVKGGRERTRSSWVDGTAVRWGLDVKFGRKEQGGFVPSLRGQHEGGG